MSESPRYCPNCGATIQRSHHATVLLIDDENNVSWDTHCKECDWSGDISFDSQNVPLSAEEAKQKLEDLKERARRI